MLIRKSFEGGHGPCHILGMVNKKMAIGTAIQSHELTVKNHPGRVGKLQF
jgi:hypothetical protein